MLVTQALELWNSLLRHFDVVIWTTFFQIKIHKAFFNIACSSFEIVEANNGLKKVEGITKLWFEMLVTGKGFACKPDEEAAL